jgi:hypothetical protein
MSGLTSLTQEAESLPRNYRLNNRGVGIVLIALH